MSSYTSPSNSLYKETLTARPFWSSGRTTRLWQVFAAAVFLVSVPVFIEAPLVRYAPMLSLVLTAAWLGLSWLLSRRSNTQIWGDLLFGFSWTWLAGSIYWGWLRWEPLLHLPIEAIGLPAAAYYLARQQGKVGNWFYLGSLFGTAVTDIYFYLVDLIPHWRQLMQVEPQLAAPILTAALAQIHTPWGAGCALMLVAALLSVGIWPLRHRQLHWWAFGGAVLSTLLVDGLFWIAATNA